MASMLSRRVAFRFSDKSILLEFVTPRTYLEESAVKRVKDILLYVIGRVLVERMTLHRQ